MLADLFYLSTIWLVLSLLIVLSVGTRLRHSDPFTSLLFLALLVALGDSIAIWWLRESFDLVLVPSIIFIIIGLALILLLRDWNAPAQAFFLFSLTTTALYLFYALAITALSPLSLPAFLFSFFLLLLETAALGLALTYAFEVLDVLCRVRWHRLASPLPSVNYFPMVSFHVPAYNEPPELVEKTLRSLAQLDYPNYQVIVIDNNTPKEETWQPLVQICKELGFQCLHLDRWPGYKSGALNFALAMTDPRAEIIAVIDADYLVQPDYLRRLVTYFQDPEIAFVQTPQDYREYEHSRFFQAAYDGYKYFFALSMPSRNERNSIIFCGTMGLLRKKVLQEIGGWDEWCITEDAEASLRILNRGYKSIFVPETFGRGLMPLDFEGLKKQRFRWAFGGVQILKKHWSKMMPWAHWLDPENKLTAAQRYFYLMSGLQWFNELVTFAFTIMVLISVALTITGHTSFLRPTAQAFVIVPIVLIGTNLLRAVWALRHALSISWQRAFYALALWFGLTWVVALACVQAVVKKRGVFLRTPKALTDSAVGRALQASGLEALLGTACILAGLAALVIVPSFLTLGLVILCFSQALIYLSAPSYSLLSLSSAPSHRASHVDPGTIQGNFANESRLGLQIGVIAVAAIIIVLVASLIPQPAAAPSVYSRVGIAPLLTPQAKPTLRLPIQLPQAGPTEVIPTEIPVTETPNGTATILATGTPGATSTAVNATPTSATTAAATPTSGATVVETATPASTQIATDTPIPPTAGSTSTGVPTGASTPAPTDVPTSPPPTAAPTSPPPTTAPTP